MRLLITGICGFVGATLTEALLDHAAPGSLRITGIDNLARPGAWLNRERLRQRSVSVLHGDIRLASDLESLPASDWILDAAANPSVLAGVDGQSSSRQLVEHNLLATVNLLETCKRWNAGFLLLSSSRVYSIPPLAALPVDVHDHAYRPVFPANLPGLGPAGITEQFSTAAPVSLYGATKLASETLAMEYGHAYDFPVFINRCGVMAGAGQFGKPDQGIFAYWIHSWREERPLQYIGFDGLGHQVRDCLHPRDLAPLLIRQMAGRGAPPHAAARPPSIINLSGGLASARSLHQLSQWCAQRFPNSPTAQSLEPRRPPTDIPKRPFDLPWVVLDPSLAGASWNWQPATPVHAIFEEIAQFADRSPGWLECCQ
ncbi:MAG: NAD-dependent epimerase/dehydratase family protein [Verrucomicrobiales bacterium]